MEQKKQCARCGAQVCRYSTDGLPPCLPRPKKLKESYLFLEEWNPLRSQACDAFLSTMESLRRRGCSMMGNSSNVARWNRMCVAEWERLNPSPYLKRDEFIHQLHNRITALEAALAEDRKRRAELISRLGSRNTSRVMQAVKKGGAQ